MKLIGVPVGNGKSSNNPSLFKGEVEGTNTPHTHFPTCPEDTLPQPNRIPFKICSFDLLLLRIME